MSTRSKVEIKLDGTITGGASGNGEVKYPGRKSTTLSDEGLKAWDRLQKRFTNAPDSAILDYCVKIASNLLARPGKKATPRPKKVAAKVT